MLGVLIFLGALLICPVAVSLVKYKVKAKKAELELQTYKRYGESLKDLIDSMRAKQHEFDNHINVIYSQHYLYDSYSDLVHAQREYCQELRNENRYNKLLLSGNPVIAVCLYEKFLEAEKYGIQIFYKMTVQNPEFGIPAHKQVELFGNLLDNAIEELKKLSGRRRLFVVVRESYTKIEIEVGNEVSLIDYDKIDRFFDKGYSKKGDGRGYGLYNVKKICDKYRMDISCDVKKIEGREFLVFRLTKEKDTLKIGSDR